MIKKFGDFVDKKRRDSIHQLKLIGKILQKDFKVENFLKDEDDPYIFVHNDKSTTSFDGIRIYKIGNIIALRIQNESKTHPYGDAYPLKIEEMYNDFISEKNATPEKAGQKVMEAIAKEVKSFFTRCSEAEKDEKRYEIEKEKDPGNDISHHSSGSDYSSLIYSKS